MKLIQLISGSGRGGADSMALSLGAQLQAEGHEVIYAVNPEFLRTHKLAPSPDTYWPIQHFRGLPLKELFSFNRRASDADIVLAQDSGARHFALFAKMLGLRPKVWFMRHCISGTTRFGGVQIHRLLVDHQIAVSEVIHKSLLDSSYPSDSATRIYGAVDLEPFHQPDPALVASRRAALIGKLKPGSVTIGMVARMDIENGWSAADKDQKGFDILFSALAKVSFPYLVLIFGPDTPGKHDTLRQMAHFYGADPACLQTVGFIQDMTSCYPLMDINVLPSRREGLGLALIEGMAAGCASVGSRSGGIPEIIDHEQTGLLFTEGDAEGLANCLESLATNREYRETLAKQGQRAVLKKFGAPDMAKAFYELELASKKITQA